jgi:hypothetical protein
VDHVVTFNRACPPGKHGMCELPCAAPCSEPCATANHAGDERVVNLVRDAARPPAVESVSR